MWSSVESAIAAVLNKLDGILFLKEEKTTARTAFVDKKDVIAFRCSDWL